MSSGTVSVSVVAMAVLLMESLVFCAQAVGDAPTAQRTSFPAVLKNATLLLMKCFPA